MKYEKDILEILCEAGEDGLSLHKIVLHVYNSHNTLFAPVDYNEVYRLVSNWLSRSSKGAGSMVCRSGRRGYYHINLKSSRACHLFLDFCEECESGSKVAGKDTTDRQLALFDDI